MKKGKRNNKKFNFRTCVCNLYNIEIYSQLTSN